MPLLEAPLCLYVGLLSSSGLAITEQESQSKRALRDALGLPSRGSGHYGRGYFVGTFRAKRKWCAKTNAGHHWGLVNARGRIDTGGAAMRYARSSRCFSSHLRPVIFTCLIHLNNYSRRAPAWRSWSTASALNKPSSSSSSSSSSPAHIGYARPVTGPRPGRPRHGHCFLINISLSLSLSRSPGRHSASVTVLGGTPPLSPPPPPPLATAQPLSNFALGCQSGILNVH